MSGDEWNPELRESFLNGFESLLKLLTRVQVRFHITYVSFAAVNWKIRVLFTAGLCVFRWHILFAIYIPAVKV